MSLEVVECQPENTALTAIDDILEENNRLKRMLEFAMTSHVIMNEVTTMIEDSADLWMKRAEDAVGVKVNEAEQERDTLALQLEELQEQLGDKDQEIERLRDGFVWATENLNAKEDEIYELHERLEHYEALLKELGGGKVV
ncbi:kinesin-like protein [Phytophthora cinnamomi]|uniref:kinesin-like protein n=1 Tax=Phytophthora cinnamomi TaxID=4785 RepID=UPI003559F112|nr:kinesin-like protein [Phytophthora cinnamomi]